MPSLLLDTCAVIWIGQGEPIARLAREAIMERLESRDVYVSPFTAWELSLLATRGRLNLSLDVLVWFEAFMQKRGLAFAPLPASVLVAAHRLPGSPPNDPADRILLATAREFGHAIVTRDRLILDYGVAGLVQTVPC